MKLLPRKSPIGSGQSFFLCSYWLTQIMEGGRWKKGNWGARGKKEMCYPTAKSQSLHQSYSDPPNLQVSYLRKQSLQAVNILIINIHLLCSFLFLYAILLTWAQSKIMHKSVYAFVLRIFIFILNHIFQAPH